MELGVIVKVPQAEIIDLTVPGSLTFLLLVIQTPCSFSTNMLGFFLIKVVMTAELCSE